jgi:ABC-type polar amino acid transport system ATPase subunit
MIRISQLVKFHGKNRVLDGLNLTIESGEVTALIGPSGGGKSTLLRCINGLETFQEGEIQVGEITLVGGRATPQSRLLELRRHVGMVFQQFHLFPHMTALENVMSGPRFVLGQSFEAAEAKAKQLLERVGLAEKAGSMPAQLSGGQQQRVAIARSLAVNPAVILFDEPTSALDPAMSREVLAVMRDLAKDGLTMIVVSHDMDLAKQAKRLHIMERGQIIKSGTADELLSNKSD